MERRNVANRGGRIRQSRNAPRFPPKMRRSNRRAQAGQREGYCKKLRSNIGCLGIVGIARPPSRPVDAPSHGFPAPRTLEAVVAFAVHHRPRRLVDRHMVDLRQAPQDKKASVSSPPTGSSTDGSISTDPAHPQTAPVYRILVQRNRFVANNGRGDVRQLDQWDDAHSRANSRPSP